MTNPYPFAQDPSEGEYSHNGYSQNNNPQGGYPQSAYPQAGYSQGAYSQTPPKSKLAAALLAFFLGQLGIHNFYLGYNGRAIGQLCLAVFGYLTLIVIVGAFFLAAAGIWALVDFVAILIGANYISKDANGRPLA